MKRRGLRRLTRDSEASPVGERVRLLEGKEESFAHKLERHAHAWRGKSASEAHRESDTTHQCPES